MNLQIVMSVVFSPPAPPPAEDWLLVGTKPGHLLLYRIKKDAGVVDRQTVCLGFPLEDFIVFNQHLFFFVVKLGTNRFEVTLEKSNKNFSKKIQQVKKNIYIYIKGSSWLRI